jgi:allose kinase
MSYVTGIDIGGTNLRIGMVSKDGLLYNFEVESSSILNKNKNYLKNLENYIYNSIKKHGAGNPLAIVIGFPSTISKDKRIVYSSPNIEGFDNINVADPLKEAFGVPVFIDNDVNFLLFYEIVMRGIEHKGIVLGFYIGTGFGNAIYLDDHFLEGKHGAAAEMGHTPVLGKSDKCSCGNLGCIELYASGKRLEELNNMYFPKTHIKEIFVKHRNEPVIQEFIKALSIPIATQITIFDPDFIVLGGGVINMNAFPKEDLEKYIYKNTRKPYPAEGLNIIYAQNDPTTGVIGAGLFGYKKLSSMEKLDK